MRRAVRWRVVATLVMGALMANAPARADDTSTREAKRRFEEGIARTQAGDWEGARLSFRQSLAASASQNALFNLALAEEKCARPLEALAHFKQYIEWPSLSQAERTQGQRHIADLAAKTGHIDVRAPAGAVLGVDASKDVGTAPLDEPIDVTPGHHVVVAKIGTEARTVDVNAVAGQVTRVAFKAEEPAPTPAVAPVPAPPPVAPAAVGEAPRAVPPPQTVTPEQATTASGPSAARIATVASMGGAAALAGLGGLYFGQQSNSDADSANALRAQNPVCTPTPSSGCQHLQDVLRSAHTEHVTADVLFVVGGTLAVAAVATWALWPTRARSSVSAFWVVPTAGPGGGGFVAMGRF